MLNASQSPVPETLAPIKESNHHQVLEDQIAPLATMSLQDLQHEWRYWFKSAPPAGFSQDMLGRAIANRMQEKALGGLDAQTKRRLKALAARFEVEGGIGSGHRGLVLRPGTKLVRTWRSQTYRVLVLNHGFEYDGEVFNSLSKIANQITGSHWSGPRFFGLKKRSKSKPST